MKTLGDFLFWILFAAVACYLAARWLSPSEADRLSLCSSVSSQVNTQLGWTKLKLPLLENLTNQGNKVLTAKELIEAGSDLAYLKRGLEQTRNNLDTLTRNALELTKSDKMSTRLEGLGYNMFAVSAYFELDCFTERLKKVETALERLDMRSNKPTTQPNKRK